MKKVFYSLSIIALISMTFSCNEDRTAEIEALQKQLTEAKNQISKKMETPKTGLVHSVFFWLKEDLDEAQKAKFKAGIASLREISHIQSCYIGPAAGTENRDVVDHSYSLALLCHFADQAGQDAYQIDPIHLKFVEDCKDLWTKVIVYDSLVE